MGNDFKMMGRAELAEYASAQDIRVEKDSDSTEIIKAILTKEYSNTPVATLKDYAESIGISNLAKCKKSEVIKALVNFKIQIYGEPKTKLNESEIPQRTLITAPGVTFLKKRLGEGKFAHTIFTICPSCGEKICAVYFSKKTTDKACDDRSVQRLFARCPNCKEKLGLIAGQFIERDETTEASSAFGELRRKNVEDIKKEVKDKIDVLLSSNDTLKGNETSNPVAKNVLSSVDSLKQYILHLINMESEIYLLIERLTTLQEQEIENKRSECRAKSIIFEDAEIYVKSKSLKLNEEIKKLENEIKNQNYKVYRESIKINPSSVIVNPDSIAFEKKPLEAQLPKEPDIRLPWEPVKPQVPKSVKPVKPAEPMYKQPSLFNKKKIQTENDLIREKYEENLREYNRLNEIYDSEFGKYANALLQYEKDYSEYRKKLTEYLQANTKYRNDLDAYQKAKAANEEENKKQYDLAYKKAREKAYNELVDAEYALRKAELRKEKDQVKKELEKRNSELRKIDKEKLAIQKQRIACLPQELAASFISDEKNNLEKELKAIVKVRDKFYSYNIIYGKYRNYVALTTLYEYLDSGRCRTLDGSDGAYNLLETEMRANEIITQLNTIASSLEDIKDNQFMLYKELKEVNTYLASVDHSMKVAVNELYDLNVTAKENSLILSEISNGIEKMNTTLDEINGSIFDLVFNTDIIERNTSSIARSSAITASNTGEIVWNTAEIAENTYYTVKNTAATAAFSAINAHYSAITAHYSKVNAELTNAMGFLLAMK